MPLQYLSTLWKYIWFDHMEELLKILPAHVNANNANEKA